MGKFSAQSDARLGTCDPRLQELFRRVVQGYDCSILVGYRSGEQQDAAYRSGRSDKPAGSSKHNRRPSAAVDVAPFPVDWNDKERFYHFAGYVKAVSEFMGIPIRWGGDWNENLNFKDQTLFDLDHFELKED